MDYHQAHKSRRKRCFVNRFLSLTSLLCLGLLAGCNIYLTPTPAPVPALKVRNLSLETSYSVGGRAAVCDNKTTQITYRFSYEGNLESWSSYLRGEKLDKVVLPETFTPKSSGVSPYETRGYEVIYNLPPNTAPYTVNPAGGTVPQGIVVVPDPTEIGATRLYLTLRSADGETKPFVSDAIPVLINCS